MMRRLGCCAAMAALLVVRAAAQANEWPTSRWHNWMATQHSVSDKQWCCDVLDGHLLEADQWDSDGLHYRAEIRGKRVELEDGVLVDPAGGPNQTGKAIVWYGSMPGAHSQRVDLGPGEWVFIYCFAPGPQG